MSATTFGGGTIISRLGEQASVREGVLHVARAHFCNGDGCDCTGLGGGSCAGAVAVSNGRRELGDGGLNEQRDAKADNQVGVIGSAELCGQDYDDRRACSRRRRRVGGLRGV